VLNWFLLSCFQQVDHLLSLHYEKKKVGDQREREREKGNM
jgi:hypothetical protein